MTNDPQEHGPDERSGSSGPPAREPAAPARRWADIFGDLLPDQTGDDTDDPAERSNRSHDRADPDDLERFRRDKPPHHVD